MSVSLVKTINHSIFSNTCEQLLRTWAAMDVSRLSADNVCDFTPEYVAAHIAPVIDGPMHVCDQCGGDGYIANSWDCSSSFHPCYACNTAGVTTYPAYEVRKYVCEQALALGWDD